MNFSKKKKVFIIAEAGVNHNGNLKYALKLVDLASKAGADAIKFQTFKAEDIVTGYAKKAKYQFFNSNRVKNQFQMLKKLELTNRMHNSCIKRCKKKKITFISSAFDVKSLRYLNSLKLKYFKVPSGEITNRPYLEYLRKLNKKIILSTGMSNISEIKKALNILTKCGTKKKNITLMQCTTEYPCPHNQINLNVLKTYKKKFKIKIGFSDHSLGPQASIASVCFGAEIIEKHITISKNLNGPDHKASLSFQEFKYLVDSIRIVEKALGSEIKKATRIEKKNMICVRKSIVAKINIAKGEKFTKNNITFKRPGNGISPMLYKKIIGKKSKFNFFKDDLLKLNYLEKNKIKCY